LTDAPQSPFHVEAMREDDVPAVAALGDPNGTPDARESNLRTELGRSWARCWVAREADGRAAAFLVAWHVADELHVLDLATRIDRRRRGMGRALLEGALAYARANRVRQVLLEVRRSNVPAIALYRAVGFFAAGIRAGYYPDAEDAIEMSLVLEPATGAILVHPDRVRLD